MNIGTFSEFILMIEQFFILMVEHFFGVYFDNETGLYLSFFTSQRPGSTLTSVPAW
jgi:hypothetical protein